MQINSVNNTNFKAIYKLPLEQKCFEAVTTEIIPAYVGYTKRPIDLHINPNIYKNSIQKVIKSIAKINGASEDWVIANAKNNGVDFTDIEKTRSFYVVTGKKDIIKFQKFINKRLRINAPSFFERLMLHFNIVPKRFQNSKTVPMHLSPLVKVLENYGVEKRAFENKFSEEIVNVTSAHELMRKIIFAEKL